MQHKISQVIGWPIVFGVIALLLVLPVKSDEAKTTNRWQDKAPMPHRVQEIYPTVFKGHIVVAGGLSPDVKPNKMAVSDRVVLYSLKHQRWQEGPALPEARHHPMLVVIDNRLLSFGGFTVDERGEWHNSTDVLEWIANTSARAEEAFTQGQWKTIAHMPTPLAETLSAVHSGRVHLATGRTPLKANRNCQWIDQGDVNTHYVFDPKDNSWTRAPEVPTARNSACSVQVEGKWHTIGGRTVGGGNLASHQAYDFKRQQWQSLPPMPQAQGGLACAAIGSTIYVFGGEYFNHGGGVYPQVWRYDTQSQSWSQTGEMPSPRHGLGALSIDNKIYVIGGALKAGGEQTTKLLRVFVPGE